MPERILIVDDDQFILAALSQILKQNNYIIQTSPSGDLFLTGLPSEPDLILLDKQLPGMDGVEICKSLKKEDATRHIPVILMSSVAGLKAYAKEAHADDYIEKPFVISNLLKKIRKQIEKRTSQSGRNSGLKWMVGDRRPDTPGPETPALPLAF
jgi:DNA-binding response OmpR family regulator